MKKKTIAIVILFLVLINAFSPLSQIMASVNREYYDMENGGEDFDGSINTSSILLKWTGEIFYTVAYGIENAGAKIVKAFTGKEFFPWADKIIFNTIPILDVNFINPARGSLMKNVDGDETGIGTAIRNIYFTSLSIALGFLGIVIAVAAIRLAISTIASDKAKLKESIVSWLTCLVLILALHYLLSFLFFVNEKMVQTASVVANNVLQNASDSTVATLKAQADENNEKVVESFLARCEKEALIDSIPIVGEIVSFARDLIHSIGKALEAAWKWITGQDDDEDEISVDMLGKMYPNKQDYLDWFRDKSDEKTHKVRIDVAAYLLKNKYYRAEYLKWISGNDTNDITNSGLAGVGRNILITCNDCLGIVDTGYKALRTLFTSVAMITYQGGNGGKPFNSVAEDVDTSDASEDADLSELNAQKERSKLEDGETAYLYKIIHSTEDYNNLIDECDKQITQAQADLKKDGADKSALNSKIFALRLEKLYAEAYYEYVYEGDDKYVPKASDTISSLGEYFRESSWYVDTDNGDWAPTSMNVVSAVCYAVFIVQSLMFLIAYFKRFFYVIILSVIGPIVVVYDYFIKSI